MSAPLRCWSVQRLEDDERIELPDLARFAADTTLDAKVRPKAGSVLGGAILTGVGVAVLATGGLILASGGCRGSDGPNDPNLCFTSLALLPLGAALGLAGGVWWAVSHSPSVEIVGDHTPRPPHSAKVGFGRSAAGFTLRF